MPNLDDLLNNNKQWAASEIEKNPDFFKNLALKQEPEVLWIGCADSRVPTNLIAGLAPGEVFVHRNIANVVAHSDLNCLSVLEYAVSVLKVKHVIVCGHYGCGGVQAAMQNIRVGLIDNWLRHIKDVREKHEQHLATCDSEEERFTKLCELNVIEQANNVCSTTIVQNAWEAGQDLTVHAWIYGLKDGLLNDLHQCIKKPDEVSQVYRLAVSHA